MAVAALLASGVWAATSDSYATPSTPPSPVATSTPSAAASGPDAWAALTPAQATSDDAAVTALVAKLASAQAALTTANQAAELAEQKAALAHQELQLAQAAGADATARLEQARNDLNAATDALRQVAVADYMTGTSSSVSILLSVTDPTRLRQSEAVHSQLASAKATVIAQADAAEQQFDALNAAAQAAQQRARAADVAATSTQSQALAQVAEAQKQTTDLATAVAQARLTQQQDLAVQAGLTGGYAAPTLTAAEASTYAAQAATAAAAPLAPRAKTWTPAMGQSAAYRALTQLVVPYSWAGGNAKGPTLGINSAGGGENDGSIKGFDCSGLALYAWAPYLSLAHDAATQYAAAGKLHPTPDQLLPGDLIFWSTDATAAGIHHVAIYLGGGLVVQAPQSGDVVRITPMSAVAPGIFGATRPLS